MAYMLTKAILLLWLYPFSFTLSIKLDYSILSAQHCWDHWPSVEYLGGLSCGLVDDLEQSPSWSLFQAPPGVVPSVPTTVRDSGEWPRINHPPTLYVTKIQESYSFINCSYTHNHIITYIIYILNLYNMYLTYICSPLI